MKQFLLLLMVAFTLGSCEIYDRVDELELTADALTKEDGYLSAALVEANIALADATALLEAAIAANAELTAENAALIAANMTEVDAQLAEIIASDELTAQEISDLEASVSVVKEDVMAYVDAQIDALQTELTAAIADGDEDAINKLQADIAAAIAAGLRGEDGADGEDGAQGPAGNDGAPGADGTGTGTGTAGPAGPQGETGPAGPKGDTGAQGEPGTNGTNGTNGLDAGDTGVDVIIYNGDWTNSGNEHSGSEDLGVKVPGTENDCQSNGTRTFDLKYTTTGIKQDQVQTSTVSVVGIADSIPPVADPNELTRTIDVQNSERTVENDGSESCTYVDPAATEAARLAAGLAAASWSPAFELQTVNFTQTKTFETVSDSRDIIVTDSNETLVNLSEANGDTVNNDGDNLDTATRQDVRYTANYDLGFHIVEGTLNITDNSPSTVEADEFVKNSSDVYEGSGKYAGYSFTVQPPAGFGLTGLVSTITLPDGTTTPGAGAATEAEVVSANITYIDTLL